jgi:hypothetical protein
MEIFNLTTDAAGLRVTVAEGRVELLVTVGAAGFAATLTAEQAERLALALLRGVPPQTEPRRMRTFPRRVNTNEGA